MLWVNDRLQRASDGKLGSKERERATEKGQSLRGESVASQLLHMNQGREPWIGVFIISYKAGCVLLNSFSFYLSKFFISLSIPEESLAEYTIFSCRVFLFITLNVSCFSLLAFKSSAEKSVDSLTGIPLFLTSCFSLAAF